MKAIYIAGPYTADNAWLVEQNVRQAEAVAYQVAGLGVAVICPHSMSRFWNGTYDYQYWCSATMELLLRCDAVLFLDGWQDSEGSVGEYEEAQRHGMPCFMSLDLLSDWLNETCDPVDPEDGEARFTRADIIREALHEVKEAIDLAPSGPVLMRLQSARLTIECPPSVAGEARHG